MRRVLLAVLLASAGAGQRHDVGTGARLPQPSLRGAPADDLPPGAPAPVLAEVGAGASSGAPRAWPAPAPLHAAAAPTGVTHAAPGATVEPTRGGCAAARPTRILALSAWQRAGGSRTTAGVASERAARPVVPVWHPRAGAGKDKSSRLAQRDSRRADFVSRTGVAGRSVSGVAGSCVFAFVWSLLAGCGGTPVSRTHSREARRVIVLATLFGVITHGAAGFTCGATDDATTCLALADLYASTSGSAWTYNAGWSAASAGAFDLFTHVFADRQRVAGISISYCSFYGLLCTSGTSSVWSLCVQSHTNAQMPTDVGPERQESSLQFPQRHHPVVAWINHNR